MQTDTYEDAGEERRGFPELGRARELVAANDAPGAEALLTELVKRDDAPLAAHILYIRVLFRRRKIAAAVTAAREIESKFPSDWRAAAQSGQILLLLNRAEEAEEHLKRACKRFPGESRLHALCAEAQLMAGDPGGALETITNMADEADNPRLTALQIVCFDATGQRGKAARRLRLSDPPPEGLKDIYRDAARNMVARGRSADAIILAKFAVRRLPGAIALQTLRAELLLQSARYEDAAQAAQFQSSANDVPPDEAVRLLLVQARALQNLKDTDGAVAALEHLLTLKPDSEDALRDLYIIHQKAGRIERMRKYGKQLSGAGAKRMPATLAEGLAEIHGNESRRRLPHTEQRKLDWAWEIADETRWTKDAWLERLRWGQAADRLLRAWWLNLPERASEIDALIDVPTHCALNDVPLGARCLCAGTHMGPLAAAVRYLQTCGRPFRGFGFAGADPVVGDAPPMRIASRGGAGIRELLSEIAKGTLIGFAAETPEPEKNLSFDFLGRKVLLPTFVPRLVHRQQTASLWWHALWRDGRIVIELERLPDPADGEDIDVFCQRWVAAYLAHVEKVVRGAPENLNLGPGIWSNVTR